MNHFVTLLVSFAFLFSPSITFAADPQPAGQAGGWDMVFNDEFTGTSLDLTKWIMCNPSFASSCNPWNNEQEKYNTAQTGNKNIIVSDGVLHLVTTKESNGQIWSGMISTGPNKFNYNQPGYQSFQFTYGYYEGRVKMPKGNGFWPSLWMLPDQDKYGPWPDSGEYDVVEVAGNDPTKYHFTSHWGPNGSGICGHPCTPQVATVVDMSAGYHTYGFEWQPDGLTWYFDGQKMGNKITDPGAIKQTPFYIIANFSVGGSWPPLNGAPDGSTKFPASMDIDYLRVWQKSTGTKISLDLLFHGIGEGGDSSNAQSGGTSNPIRVQRPVTVEVLNTQNQVVASNDGVVTFNPSSGNFTGEITMGNTLASGAYTVRVKSEQYLRTLVPGIQTITQGQPLSLAQTVLITGDITGDNVLNIADYNVLMGCYSDLSAAVSCTNENNTLADLTDDGQVNHFDYNLFLRELNNNGGQ